MSIELATCHRRVSVAVRPVGATRKGKKKAGSLFGAEDGIIKTKKGEFCVHQVLRSQDHRVKVSRGRDLREGGAGIQSRAQ